MASKTRAAVIYGLERMVEELGGDSGRVARESEVDLSVIVNPDVMIPTRTAMNVLNCAAKELDCDHFGLLLAERQDLDSYLGLLGQIMRSAPTLRVALEHAFGFSSLQSDASLWQLHPSDAVSHVSYSLLEGSDEGSKQIQQLVIALLWRVAHAITDDQWHPATVNFMFKRPADISPYRHIFDTTVLFDCDFCGIVFHSSDLNIEIRSHDDDVHHALHRFATDVQKREPRSFDDQVRILIRKNLEIQKVGAEDVTQFLPYETRTLQRKLKECGTSYRELLNEVRVELAKEWLHDSDIPITRLSERLCYSSLATMTRAFKIQTGMSPTAWRGRVRKPKSN